MGWVRNVVLMNVYLGLEKPQGVGISGEGPHGQVRKMRGVSLRATRERGGRILSQQGGFQVSGKGSKGIIMYIAYLVRVYRVRQLFLDYFQTAGRGRNIVFEFFAIPNRIFSSICRRQNVNKGLSSANHSATGEESSDHHWRTLRRTVHTRR
jgi:hypothetical protein